MASHTMRDQFGPDWTRSIQRIEGVWIVVDQRPGIPVGSLSLHSDAYGPAGRLPDVMHADVTGRVLDRVRDVWTRDAFTLRIDNQLRYGAGDLADLYSRAIRQHLAAPLVEPEAAPSPQPPASTPAAARRMPRTVQRAEVHGHVLKWTPAGGECVQCGAVLADSDAQTFERGGSGDVLGAFVRACPEANS